jgi:uncharacterized integral membrane protein
MIGLLRGLLAILGAVVLVAFAVGNRGLVSVSLWPTPFALELPLWVVLMLGLFAGAVLGGLASWLGGWRRRAEAGRWRRRAERLEREQAARKREEEQALRARAAAAVPPPASSPAGSLPAPAR